MGATHLLQGNYYGFLWFPTTFPTAISSIHHAVCRNVPSQFAYFTAIGVSLHDYAYGEFAYYQNTRLTGQFAVQTFTSPAAVVISLPSCAFPVKSAAPRLILMSSIANQILRNIM